jgi:hypothetical protein
MLSSLNIHKTDVGIMDQGSSLQRLARLFVRQLRGSKFAEFIVDEWKQLLGRTRIAILNL